MPPVSVTKCKTPAEQGDKNQAALPGEPLGILRGHRPWEMLQRLCWFEDPAQK